MNIFLFIYIFEFFHLTFFIEYTVGTLIGLYSIFLSVLGTSQPLSRRESVQFIIINMSRVNIFGRKCLHVLYLLFIRLLVYNLTNDHLVTNTEDENIKMEMQQRLPVILLTISLSLICVALILNFPFAQVSLILKISTESDLSYIMGECWIYMSGSFVLVVRTVFNCVHPTFT